MASLAEVAASATPVRPREVGADEERLLRAGPVSDAFAIGLKSEKEAGQKRGSKIAGGSD